MGDQSIAEYEANPEVSEGLAQQLTEINFDARTVARQLGETLPVTNTVEKPSLAQGVPTTYTEVRSGILASAGGQEVSVSRREEGLVHKSEDREVLGVLVSFPDIDNPHNTIEIDPNGRLHVIPDNDFTKRTTLEVNQLMEGIRGGRQSITIEHPLGFQPPLDKILASAKKGLDFLKTATLKAPDNQTPPTSPSTSSSTPAA